jgi:small-conductance mechanosensitive channel
MARNLAFFEANPEQFDALSDEDRMLLANGETIEGETEGESPDANGTEETAVEGGDDDADDDGDDVADIEQPEVMAKDGKHTIPFEELQAARDSAKRLEELVRQQSELIESLKNPAAPQAQESNEPTLDDKLAEIRQEIEDAALLDEQDKLKGLIADMHRLIAEDAQSKSRAEISKEFEARDQRAREAAAQSALDAVAAQAAKDYPFLDSQSASANQDAIGKVVRYRNALIAEGAPLHEALAEAVKTFAPMYQSKPQGTASQQASMSAKEAAEKAIAGAKSKVPTSMSSIPSAASPATDEVQAMSGMSAQALQDKMMDLPREKIIELMNRTLVS